MPGAGRGELGAAGEEWRDGVQEGLRLLNMDPVPGTFDAHDPGLSEQTADLGFVLGLNVVGAGARDEQGRPRIDRARRDIRETDDLGEPALDCFEVQAPTRA